MPKKTKLNLSNLEVSSFKTSNEESLKGGIPTSIAKPCDTASNGVVCYTRTFCNSFKYCRK